MNVPPSSICFPGDELSIMSSHKPSSGSYEFRNSIYSSLFGTVRLTSHDDKKLVSVSPVTDRALMPEIDDVVLAQVTFVSVRTCRCNILSVNAQKISHMRKGVIRREDVRSTEKDKVDLYACFRVGDYVLAKVLALGETMAFLLSTGEDKLGVVVAKGGKSLMMIPISWREMQCPVTFEKQSRKVAMVDGSVIERWFMSLVR